MHRPGRAPARLEVQPHACGPWLVRVGGRRLAVAPAMGRALLPLHGHAADPARLAAALAAGTPRRDPEHFAAAAVVAGWLAGTAGSPPARRRSSLPLRAPLVPAAAVRAAARALAPLAGWPALAVAGAGGLAVSVAARPWAGRSVLTAHGDVPWALLLFAAGALWHELGHAAALRREGYVPGGIGAGWLVLVPVLYADVSAVALLPRAGRLRVDLAGMAFQAGAAGLLAGAAAWLPLPAAAFAPLRAAAVASLAALAGALLPLPRSDGGWALRDLLGADAAHRRPLRALRAAQQALLGLACLLLPARVAGLGGHLLGLAGVRVPPPALVGGARLLTAVAVAAWIARLFTGARPGAPALSCPPATGEREEARMSDDNHEREPDEVAPTALELDGVLDLHMFPAAEARDLVDDWLDASREAGLRDLRIIHGKGIGALRTLVHAALDARHDIESYALANDAGSWGATVIRMKP